MKKIIITEDNYENIMFDLVENNYSKDNTEDLLNQIDSDVFLKFEWQQWNKAKYDESTEVYKNNEKEFIESLLQTEDKKFLLIGLIWRYSVAASILLLLGFYYFFSAADSKEIKSELFVKQVDKTWFTIHEWRFCCFRGMPQKYELFNSRAVFASHRRTASCGTNRFCGAANGGGMAMICQSGTCFARFSLPNRCFTITNAGFVWPRICSSISGRCHGSEV